MDETKTPDFAETENRGASLITKKEELIKLVAHCPSSLFPYNHKSRKLLSKRQPARNTADSPAHSGAFGRKNRFLEGPSF